MSNLYNREYFERGVQEGISGYTNYHWRPEYVLPMANQLKKMFGNDIIYLDYGCAKGFLVKALRMLGCDAYGYDISEYAIQNCEPEVTKYVSSKEVPVTSAHVIIMKDILEHVPEDTIVPLLTETYQHCQGIVVAVIPLGDNGLFRIREFELDKTHVTKQDEVWWTNKFKEAGFSLREFYYDLPGFKDNWKQFPTGNGIFIFEVQ